MKKIGPWLLIAAFLFLYFGLPVISAIKSKKEIYYCPVCDARIEYEADPEFLEDWLNEKGYDLVYREFLTDYINDFIYDNPDWVSDFLADNAADYLTDNGWTLIPPEGTP